MSDAVSVLPELPVAEQIGDLSAFFARSLPENEQSQLLAKIQTLVQDEQPAQQTAEDEEAEAVRPVKQLGEDEKAKGIEAILSVITGGHPGLESSDRGELTLLYQKDSRSPNLMYPNSDMSVNCWLRVFAEIESQYLLLTTLILSTSQPDQKLKDMTAAVVKSASGSKKADVACRV